VTPLRYRGPDDEGEYLDAHAALDACRPSLVDLAGGQPAIGNETGTVHAVLNGEIASHEHRPRCLCRSALRHDAASFQGK
jgi:asparagine synthetase B (glutamine-hydrolysing)